MKRFLPFFAAALICLPAAAGAQVFGSFTSAAIASEGEGGIFVMSGSNTFRAGVMSRYLITRRTDVGIQLGLDQRCEKNTYGGSLDLKLYIIGSESTIPLDLSVTGSVAHLRSDSYARNIFGIGFIVSGLLRSSGELRFEPYASINLMNTHFGKRPLCGTAPRKCWPCREDDWNTDTDTVLRAGFKLPVTNDMQLLAEVELNDDTAFGAALNIIF